MSDETSFGGDLLTLFRDSSSPHAIIGRDLRIIATNEAYASAMRMNRHDSGKGAQPKATRGDTLAYRKATKASLETTVTKGARHHTPLFFSSILDTHGIRQDRCRGMMHHPVRDISGATTMVVQTKVDLSYFYVHGAGALEKDKQARKELFMRSFLVQARNRLLDLDPVDLQALLDDYPCPAFIALGKTHCLALFNSAFSALAVDGALAAGGLLEQLFPFCARNGVKSALDDVLETGKPTISTAVALFERAMEDGMAPPTLMDYIYLPLIDETGKTFGVLTLANVAIDHSKAVARGHNDEKQFTLLAEAVPTHVWTAKPNGALDWVNRHACEYYGRTPCELYGSRWQSVVHPDDIVHTSEVWKNALANEAPYQTEFRLRRYDGVYRWFITRAIPFHDDGGVLTQWTGINADIEDRKSTETALACLNATLEDRVRERTDELLRTQDALRQSQKMEAIGNLAGGIAHDFNNLLQIIAGNLQLMSRNIIGNEPAERLVSNALSGVFRGTRLTSQLLAFSRQQALEPRVLNLGVLVRDVDNLVRRSVGDGVIVKTIVALDLWNTLVDPSSLENALLNLAINARDAMDSRGELTLEVSNIAVTVTGLEPPLDIPIGDYVALCVTDTGSGIAPEIIGKVFDPFFTTKPEGKGTGLGLSMVYGFVKQSGGYVRLFNLPQRGLSVHIFLPRSHQAADVAPAENLQAPLGGDETVLVVEDDDAVRETTVALLAELGYKVLRARNADDAFVMLQKGAAFDLLFSDVMMPGKLSSWELAREVKKRLPDVAVLFVTGYMTDAFLHDLASWTNSAVLSKPYTRQDLARKVRQSLSKSPEAEFPSQRSETILSPSPISGGRCSATEVAPHTAAAHTGLSLSDHENPPHDVRASKENQMSQTLKGLLVLICEDEALIRMSICDMLEEFGAVVTEAANAREALAHLEKGQFDIVVTDVGLPDLSGLELVKIIRKTHEKLPVIFATGAMEVAGSEALDHVYILRKPYSFEELCEAIAHIRTDG